MKSRFPLGLRPLAALAIFTFAAGTLAACDTNTADGGDTTATASVPNIGDLYPSAMVKDCDGGDVSMTDWIAQNDVSYITFGAKWCTACKLEAPVINEELVRGLANESVGVAQLLIEFNNGQAPPQSLCAEWRDDLSAEYVVLVDTEQNSVPDHFGVEGITTLPVHYIVSRDGTIRLRKVGELPSNIKELVSDWLP